MHNSPWGPERRHLIIMYITRPPFLHAGDFQQVCAFTCKLLFQSLWGNMSALAGLQVQYTRLCFTPLCELVRCTVLPKVLGNNARFH